MANALDSDSKDREFESLRADHVVASYISLAATFFLYLIRKSPRTHSTAPPLQGGKEVFNSIWHGLATLSTVGHKPCIRKACLLSLFNFMNYCISCNAYNTADYIKNYIVNIKCAGCKNILQHFNYYRN